jgi:hypothetical protein
LGSQLKCKVRRDGQTSIGTALLETNEIILRGDVRLKIPLALLKSVVSRKGELHLQWPEGKAVLELGDNADKWAHKILYPKSLTQKLGVKPGLIVSAIAIEDSKFAADLRSQSKEFSDGKPLHDSDLIFFGAKAATQLSQLTKLAPSLRGEGALWIVYPKGAQQIKEQHVLDAGRQAGLVDVKVVSFSATHTALKFVRPKAERPPHLSTRRA